MRKLAIAALLVACACSTNRPVASVAQSNSAGHGAISVQLPTESVRARLGYQNTYHFPVEMIVRETNGHPVQIARVAVHITNDSIRYSGGTGYWSAADLQKLGMPTTIPANGEVTLKLDKVRGSSFNKEIVPTGVTAEIVVQAVDETKTESRAWGALTVVTR